MDQEKVLNIAKEYAAAVRKVVDATAIFLYGSYAKGTATKDSDIDDGNTPTDPGTDIGDDDVPVTPAKPPKTGDSMGLWIAAAMVSGMGLIWLSLSGKKRKEEI